LSRSPDVVPTHIRRPLSDGQERIAVANGWRGTHLDVSEIAHGKSNQAIADKLVLTGGAVEKHVNGIFLKLRPTTAKDLSRRVKGALICLAHRYLGVPSGS
jgi:hypothetical protein